MGEVYSIVGLFYGGLPFIYAWGGYFIRGERSDKENQIAGSLMDPYGPSRLEGIMEGKTLQFRKRRINPHFKQEFDYNFSLKDGIWLGEYTSSDKTKSEASICKTDLFLGKLIFGDADERTPEGYAKAIVEDMIENGLLKKVKDPETGKEMILPVR